MDDRYGVLKPSLTSSVQSMNPSGRVGGIGSSVCELKSNPISGCKDNLKQQYEVCCSFSFV